MKVYYDARYVRVPVHDGVSRYSAELLAELLKVRSDVIAIVHDAAQLTQLPDGVPYIILRKPTDWREPSIARDLNRLGADVVFSPLQTMGARHKKYKLILTVHDLIYYSYRTPPREFNRAIRLLWRLFHLSYAPERYLLNRADAVVAVSDTTKTEMAAHDLTKRPVTIVPNAVDRAAFPSVTGTLRTKTLVYMGSFVPYKNVDTLVRAMNLLPEYDLILASRVGDAEKERLRGLTDRPDSLRFEGGVSDERYRELLADAAALVSASRLEGFGIPLLEAQSAGTPLVVSDIPIFHEVAGDGALYFAPDEPQAFARQVLALENLAVTEVQIDKGRANADRYSWAKSARMLSDLIDSLGKV